MVETLTPDAMAATHAAAFTDSRPWAAAEFAALIDSPFVQAIGDIRCFALLRSLAGEAEILTVATHPDHRRRGLARDLLQGWLQQAANEGVDTAFLEVAEDNLGAIALYTALGFEACGNRPGYYARGNGKTVDARLMRRSLP